MQTTTRTFTIDGSSLELNLHSIVHLAHVDLALRGTATIREVGTDRSWTFGREHRKGNAMTLALRSAPPARSVRA